MNMSIQAARAYAAGQYEIGRAYEKEALGREYLTGGYGYATSDRVNERQQEAYRKAAGGLVGITVLIDTVGDLSDRGAPDADHAWAIVDPANLDTSDAYWDVLEPMLEAIDRAQPAGDSGD